MLGMWVKMAFRDSVEQKFIEPKFDPNIIAEHINYRNRKTSSIPIHNVVPSNYIKHVILRLLLLSDERANFGPIRYRS